MSMILTVSTRLTWLTGVPTERAAQQYHGGVTYQRWGIATSYRPAPLVAADSARQPSPTTTAAVHWVLPSVQK